jgi:hypothetical protein
MVTWLRACLVLDVTGQTKASSATSDLGKKNKEFDRLHLSLS